MGRSPAILFMNAESAFFRKVVCRLLSVFGLSVLVIATIGARCWNYDRVFRGDGVYFVDADCYSRMTRVRDLQNGSFSAGYHRFENFPRGTAPHTTLPLDLLILGLTDIMQDRDMAGALIGPILGAVGAVFLWGWSQGTRGRWMLLGIYAVSPILVHGTVLGRPDHQALLIVLLAVALAGEWRVTSSPRRAWCWVTGFSWGTSFWVSLYEPVILFAAVELSRVLLLRGRWAQRERWVVWGAISGVLCLALLAERSLWMRWPDQSVIEYFPRWKTSIAELNSTFPFSELILGWTGIGILIAPVLLGFAARRDARAVPVIALLMLTWALTVWQIRWGYFLALIFTLSIPLQLLVVPKPWVAWVGFLVSLWPMASVWEKRLFPERERAVQMWEQTWDAFLLRDAARSIELDPARVNETGSILAPWWLSPPLAYWTGLPAVAGSSHESLPGTVDAARFYLTSSTDEACRIVRAHRVEWVIAYEPSRVLGLSAALLDRKPVALPIATLLFQRPHSAPEFLKFVYGNQSFKVFRVNAPNLQ
jgi:hypothetical protein